MSWQWRMMQDWRRNWLVVSKLTWRIWQILTRALKNIIGLHFNGLFLIKVYNVWANKVRRSYIWWHWRFNAKLEGPLFALSKMTRRICQIFIHRLKSSYFILYSEMENKNWKQPDQPDAAWKLYLALEINE